jgi:hypothetical protein
MERFLAGAPPRLPTPEELREAFLWAEHRQVTKQAMVSLFGNRYQVDPALIGATVELVFDPFDLGRIEVRYQRRPMGLAVAVTIGRHVHPAAKPDPATAATAPRPSGIDYLAMVEQRIAAQQRQRIAYAALPPPPSEPGGEAEASRHDHAAAGDASLYPATTIQPPDLDGIGLQLPATITPDHAGQPAADGATTTPATDVEPTDLDPNRPPLIIIDATLEEEL